MKVFLKKNLLEIVILFLLALPPVKWLWGGYIIFGHDASFYLNHWENLVSLFYAWNPIQGLGMNWPFMRGYIPMVALEEAVFRITGSFSVMQICIGVGWFFGMMMSMYVLVRSVFPEKKYWIARLLSSVLYGYNFFILQAWVIYERPKFSAYILLPLTIALIHKLYEKKVSFLQGFILFWLISLFFNAGGLPPLLGTIILAILFSLVWYWIVQLKKEGTCGFLWGIKVGLLLFFGYLLANIYWIIPFVFFTFRNYASYVGSVGSVGGTIAWEKMVSENASFANLFRLEGNPEWLHTIGHPYADVYMQNPVLIFLSIGVFAVIFVAWMIRKNQSEINKSANIMRILMILLSVFGIFMMAGTHAPFGKFYELAMRYVPGFAIFRSSFFKFAPITYLSVSWLFGYSFQRIIDTVHWRNKIKMLLAGVVIIGLVGFFFPYWTRNIFQFQRDYTTRVKVPDYTSEMKQYIEANTDIQARILVMPKLDEGYIGAPLDTSVWGFYCLGPFVSLSTNRSIIYNGLGDSGVVSSLYDQFEKGDDEAFLKIVRILGITHILYRTDVRLSPSYEKTTPLSFWEKAINQKSYLKKKYAAGAWSLYEIEDPNITPMVFLASSVRAATMQRGDLSDLLGNTPENILVINQQTIPDNVVQEQFYEAQCMYCGENELASFIDSIDINAYGNTSIITKYFQDRKEQSEFKSLSDTDPKKIDMYIVFANRALANNRLGKWSSDMLAAEKIVMILRGKNKYEYAIRLYAFAEAQKKYLHGQQEININAILPFVWVTDRTHQSIKYILDFTADTKGVFSVFVNNKDFWNWQIDGRTIRQDEQIALSKGVHFVEGKSLSVYISDIPRVYIQANNTVTQSLHSPQLRWNQESPVLFTVHVEEATGPYILGLNESFDAGWRVVRKDKPLPSVLNHFEINGVTNGWMILDAGTYDLSVYYEPQKYVNWGVTIFLVGSVCIVYLKKKI
jgi:hypothetical protein